MDETASGAPARAFGGTLRAHRQRLGMTQEELSERTGLSVRSIGKLEAGQITRPRPATLRLLADAFGLTGSEREAFCRVEVGGQSDRPGRRLAPAQLPADVAGFTGRDSQLDRLDEVLPGAGTPAGAVVITAIGGTAGVGKTALAVHWAHHVATRFPDGQLYVDLRGYSPGEPLTPIRALAGFLHALGVPGTEIPSAVDQAVAMYRSALAGKRMLVVLDNARDAEQVRPLLPASAGCLALVTSRDQLAGLVARDGAHWIGLDVLSAEEAHTLLVRMVGAARVDAEPEAAAELARRCGYLPLALRIAAAHLVTRSRQRIADEVAGLRDGDRLAALRVEGDLPSAVAAAFDLSYARLPDSARRLFRLLGLAPGRDISVEAAAALAGISAAQASGLLDSLARAHLVDEHAIGRYASHDLLRAYAADRAVRDETQHDRAAAQQRLLGWYLHAAQTAATALQPEMARLPGAYPLVDSPAITFDKPAQASGWLEVEHPNLLSAIAHAAEHGPRPVAWRLANALRGFWWWTGHLVEALAAATAAETAARREADLPGQAAARLCLGNVRHIQGRCGEAVDHYGVAMELAREAGWLEGQAAAVGGRALSARDLSQFDRAETDFAEALALNRRLGRRLGQIASLSNLGVLRQDQGRLAQAAACFDEALALDPELDTPTMASALVNLGSAERDLGHWDAARKHLTQAVARCREYGYRSGEASAMDNLAMLHRDAGRYSEALEAAEAAVRLATEVGDRRIEAHARNTLGSVHRCLGQPRQALDHHQLALGLAREGGVSLPEIEALFGLAAARHDLDDRGRVVSPAGEALALARRRGYRLCEGQALTVLAGIHLDHGDDHQVPEYAEAALHTYRQTGYRLGEARAHLLLGQFHHRAGDPGSAVDHWRRARDLFTDIGAPEADQARDLLASEPAATSD